MAVGSDVPPLFEPNPPKGFELVDPLPKPRCFERLRQGPAVSRKAKHDQGGSRQFESACRIEISRTCAGVATETRVLIIGLAEATEAAAAAEGHLVQEECVSSEMLGLRAGDLLKRRLSKS